MIQHVQLDIIRKLNIKKFFNQSRYNKTDTRFLITGSGVIDRQVRLRTYKNGKIGIFICATLNFDDQ